MVDLTEPPQPLWNTRALNNLYYFIVFLFALLVAVVQIDYGR